MLVVLCDSQSLRKNFLLNLYIGNLIEKNYILILLFIENIQHQNFIQLLFLGYMKKYDGVIKPHQPFN